MRGGFVAGRYCVFVFNTLHPTTHTLSNLHPRRFLYFLLQLDVVRLFAQRLAPDHNLRVSVSRSYRVLDIDGERWLVHWRDDVDVEHVGIARMQSR